ncbi:hypothetical protein ACJMK2_009929 [Sinanodonta woodiana]|uniref:FERM domain-containing protein n=1 Tax=Sinanodonta woodiana TaxID=1069815 RepID=A0ABD3VFD6_SINWO
MEVILCVVRPKQNVTGHEYKAKMYDILLLDHKTVDKQEKPTKYLPTFSLSISQIEPRDEVLAYLYNLSGYGDHSGIKGERALLIPWNRNEHGFRESLARFALFIVPVSHREKLNRSLVEKSSASPGFFSLDSVIDSLNNGSMNFPPPTWSYVMHLENWLKQKHLRPGALEILFHTRADYRIRMTVRNPAFLPSIVQGQENMPKSDPPRLTANETLTKLLSIEKCDKVVINPLFGSGISMKHKVNWSVQNPYWPHIPPDYEYNYSRKSSINSSMDPDNYSLEERDQYPLHSLAREGNVRGLQDYISQGYHHSKRDSFQWYPVHWAASFGHKEAVAYLLDVGASPNSVNADERTPLHIAALRGYPEIIDCLLSHPDTDLNAVDREGKTALDLAEEINGWQHSEVVQKIKTAARYPNQIQVQVMDNTKKKLNLVAGANTTVQQLNHQMLREYSMPETPYADIFTIWICSESLQLQLKPEHRPLEHMHMWNKRIVGMLVDVDPKKGLKEDPHLEWRRNAKISLLEEREAIHPEAIKLLFHEAYQNYIKGFYPCKEQDVLILASILLYMEHDQDQHGAKTFLSNSKNLSRLVPSPMLKMKGINWSSKILHKFKELSSMMSERPERFRSPQTLQIQFLNNCRNLTVYGSAFFTGNLHEGKITQNCYIGVNDVGIHVINTQSREMVYSYKYSEITWGLPAELSVLDVTVVKPETRVTNRGSTSPRKAISLRTKQAGLINHLMQKLAQMHTIMSSRTSHR